ncbi:MAG: hypothetical protein A2020_06080 [Lentisphaerae bacterium GWF2_45_14]|nr:MAG: hypothetical protein A2020_06080 [Lentisphaerae bacterium GWF2_45_14]
MRKFISPGDLEGKLIRKKNRLLSIVRKNPGISRQKCAIQMSLSTFNITKLVSELVKSNIILEDESVPNERIKGKPSTPLRLNPEHEYFAGIDFEASAWRFVILDFAGNTVFSVEMDFHACKSREEYIKLLKECLEKAMEQSGKLWEKVSNAGIGAPGYIDYKSGVITNYEVLPDFSMIPLLDIYRELSKKQVYITKNISCLAIYDLWKRPASENLTVMHAAVRSGISISLNANGSIFSGGHNRAGELGFSFSSDGNRFLQDVSGLSALKKKLPELPADFWQGNEDTVFQLLKKKNIREVLDHSMKILAMSLASATALLDPDEIIVYCPLFSEENILWKDLKDEFSESQKTQNIPLIQLIRAENAKFNAAAGAAFMSIETVYPVNPD